MTNHINKQNYRFRTWKFRDRLHLKGGVRQGCYHISPDKGNGRRTDRKNAKTVNPVLIRW